MSKTVLILPATIILAAQPGGLAIKQSFNTRKPVVLVPSPVAATRNS